MPMMPCDNLVTKGDAEIHKPSQVTALNFTIAILTRINQ